MGLIRLLLALVVAGDHFTLLILREPHGIQQWIGINAGYAVFWFYMISGFLISWVLAHKYAPNVSGTIQFYKSRFLRIYSLYWPTLIICLAAFGGMQGRTLTDYVVSITIVPGDWILAFSNYPLERTPFPDALGQVWSVAAELVFYALAPRLLRSNRLSVLCLAASLIARVALEQKFGFHQAWDYHFFPTALAFFLLGHFARVLHDSGVKIPLPMACVFLGGAIYFINRTLTTGGWPSPYFYFAASAFAAALPAVFEATKDNRLLNFLGDLSYPAYLFHMMVLTLITPIGRLPWPRHRWIALPLFLFTVVIVSWAAHRLIERPGRYMLRRGIDAMGAIFPSHSLPIRPRGEGLG